MHSAHMLLAKTKSVMPFYALNFVHDGGTYMFLLHTVRVLVETNITLVLDFLCNWFYEESSCQSYGEKVSNEVN